MKHFTLTRIFQWHISSGYKVILLLLLLALSISVEGIYQTTSLSRLVPFPVLLPAEALHAPSIGALPRTTPLEVRLSFKLSQPESMVKSQLFLSTTRNAQLASPELDKGTYQAIVDFFQRAGAVVKPSPLHTYLALSSHVSTFEKVFHIEIVRHLLQGRTFYAPASSPLLPQFIASPLLTITGLDNYSAPPQPSSLHLHSQRQLAGAKQAPNCTPSAGTLRPKQVAHAYGYDQLWNQGLHGENMEVDLVEIDAFNQSDIDNYFSCIQFNGTLRPVNIDTAPTHVVGEATLDIEMAAGLARATTIVDYQTNGNAGGDTWVQINDILQQIIKDHNNAQSVGDVVSISLGVSENAITPNDRTAIDQSLQTLTQQEHLAVFVASGDRGAFNNPAAPQTPIVSFPASDPAVIAVGGSVLSVDAVGNRLSEVAWPRSGGGTSAFFAAPSWQQVPGSTPTAAQPTAIVSPTVVQPTAVSSPTVIQPIPATSPTALQPAVAGSPTASTGNRQLPDVSAVASNLALYLQQRWVNVGGTSAAAPIWAAGIILINQSLQQQGSSSDPISSPQQLYKLAQQVQTTQGGNAPFFDISQEAGGQQGSSPQQVGPGWDNMTGLGSPALAILQKSFANSNVPAAWRSFPFNKQNTA